MGIIKSLEGWQTDVGEGVGNFVQNAVTGAASLFCGVRKKYPNSFFDRPFTRGLANSICQTLDPDEGAVFPVPPPFEGGQCEGVNYVIDVLIKLTDSDGNVTDSRPSAIAIGGITSIGIVVPSSGSDRRPRFVVVDNEPSAPRTRAIAIYGNPTVSARIDTLEVVRTDGLPDNCGSLPSNFPPDPARNPADFRTTVSVCDRNAAGEEINCEDVVIELPQKDVYDFPICIEVDGRKICLDADGWSIEDAIEVDKEKEKEEEEEEEEEVEVLDAVVVTVTESPTRGRTYLNETEELINYYAAYFSWKFKVGDATVPGGQTAVRRPVHYFKAPDEVVGYDVMEVNGAKIKTTEIKKTIKVPKEPPEE